MPNAINWQGDWVARSANGLSSGNVLTTELNALGAGAICAPGPFFTNASNGDQNGQFALSVDFATAPTSGRSILIACVQSFDGGVTYTTATTTVADFGTMKYLATIVVPNNNAALLLPSSDFRLPPGFWKTVLFNNTDQPFPPSGTTLSLYVNNDELQ
jgi:hypothetical protein